MSSIFYEDHINIFTDTSDKTIYTNKGAFKVTCPGFIATYEGRILNSGLEVYVDAETNFGEAKAVELATRWIQYTLSKSYVGKQFNIFSDSLTVVATICNYVNLWRNEALKGQLVSLKYTGDRADISWAHVAYMTAYTIFALNYPIFIYYTPGHIPVYKTPFKQKEIDHAASKFIGNNNRYHYDIKRNDVENYVVYEMATFNNVIDLITRNYLYSNLAQIQDDINAAGDAVALGSDKAIPLRWPLMLSNVPNLFNYSQRGTFLQAPEPYSG